MELRSTSLFFILAFFALQDFRQRSLIEPASKMQGCSELHRRSISDGSLS